MLFLFLSGCAPALTIFACVGVLFLGGVLRCRAPWPHNDGMQGPKLSEFTVSQQKCSLRGHCSAEAPDSGIDRSAGNTAEFKRPWEVTRWSPNGNKAPRCGGSCTWKYCLGHGDEQERACERPRSERDPSAKATALNSSRKNKKRIGERVICQRASSGRLVCSCDTSFEDFRLVDTGVCLVSRSEAEEDCRVALISGTVFPRAKSIFGSVEVE